MWNKIFKNTDVCDGQVTLDFCLYSECWHLVSNHITGTSKNRCHSADVKLIMLFSLLYVVVFAVWSNTGGVLHCASARTTI